MTNETLNKLFELLFTEEVFVNVSIRESRGMQPRTTRHQNVKAKLNGETFVLNGGHGDFFQMVRVNFTNDSDWVILPLSEKYLQRIKWAGGWKYKPIPFVFDSKTKESQFEKIFTKFQKNPTFFTARKLFMFLVKFAGLKPSSDFGFDGVKVIIEDIKDPEWNKSIANAEKRQKRLSKLHSTNAELRELIRGLESEIRKNNKEIEKLESFK